MIRDLEPSQANVGCAYRHEQGFDDPLIRSDPFAEFAVLTSRASKLRLEFRRVPLDVEPLIAVYHSSGRPFAEEAAGQYQAI